MLPMVEPVPRAARPLMLMMRPQPLADHVRRDLARAAQVAHDFDVDVRIERVVGDLGQFRRRLLAARLRGAVDQDVDVAERTGGLLDHGS